MPTFGPPAASCEILTFKEGVLSPVAHDLLLRVTRFEVQVDPAAPAVSAWFDAASLRVVHALRGGQPLPGALRPGDVGEIEAIVRRTVLRADRHPEIRFASTAVASHDGGYEVRGRLTIGAATRELVLAVRREADRLATEVRLRQPDFGIQPYRAMLGALRVQPNVVVRAAIPAAGLPASHPGVG